jgi:hypothetical protein
MFYSVEELSDVLEDIGFNNVSAKTIFAGMLGFHRSVRSYADTNRNSDDHSQLLHPFPQPAKQQPLYNGSVN